MRSALLFASAIVALAAATTAAMADEKCQLVPIAEWTLRPSQRLPVVDGAINGRKVGILLDTGSYTSFVRRSAAMNIQLRLAPLRGSGIYGVTESADVDGAYIDELRIGDLVRKDWLAPIAGERQLDGDLALVLGYDFFQQLDIELDFAHNSVRLFDARNCHGAWLAYWSKDALDVQLEGGRRLQVPVAINGKSFVAELDTGATATVLTLEAAIALGLTPQTPGVSPGNCIGGKDGLDSWIAQIDSFAIGGEIIRNPKVLFADLWRRMVYDHTSSHLQQRIQGLGDLVLGTDFLRAHRVYIAHSQSKLYFSYAGGPVFPVRPGKACAELKD